MVINTLKIIYLYFNLQTSEFGIFNEIYSKVGNINLRFMIPTGGGVILEWGSAKLSAAIRKFYAIFSSDSP